ncbi:MAG: translation initiation factor [Muribaculaceae bacterium]|nr:translation initiation factor [Muribaculaceae bacterium]
MGNDWKDTLSALRENLEDPEEDSKEIIIEDTKPKYLQNNSLHVITDRKGRNGKIATIIEGFTIQKEEVEEIARKLKQNLGVGGSFRNNEILIQGDYKEKVKNLLTQFGFKIK